MIIKRAAQGKFGTFFAIWPRWTPDGWVSLEMLHWELVEGWGWGSGDTYRYHRVRYKSDEWGHRKIDYGGKAYETDEQGRAYFGMGAESYATPPNTAACGKLQTSGPTPCHYPHCTCMAHAAYKNAEGKLFAEPVRPGD